MSESQFCYVVLSVLLYAGRGGTLGAVQERWVLATRQSVVETGDGCLLVPALRSIVAFSLLVFLCPERYAWSLFHLINVELMPN